MNHTPYRLDNQRSPACEHAQRLLTFLAERGESLSPLLILPHDYPDPDSLAAAFAFQYLLKTGFGIESRIAYRGEIGRTENRAMVRLLRIPLHRFTARCFRRYPHVALVDTQPGFENNPFPSRQRAAVVIDQHTSNGPPDAELALIDPECGATCVLVARALLEKGLDIPQRVATALTYGILTDTLDFYRAQRADVVQTYLQVLPNCDMRALARIQNPVRTRRFFSTLAQGIQGAALYRRLLVSHLGAVETPDLVSQVAEFLLAYRRVVWCLVTGRYKGRLYASLRTTRQDAPAGDVLRDVFENPRQAGGHGPIAGGSCRVGLDAGEDTWQAREHFLQDRLRKRLRLPCRIEPRKPFAQ
jgi:nanoRNase/pAp phosphatase (c-di-AMP/oligoRNAs hydrolase)